MQRTQRIRTLFSLSDLSALMETTMVPEETVVSPLTYFISLGFAFPEFESSFTFANGFDSFRNGLVEIEEPLSSALTLLLVMDTTVVNGFVRVIEDSFDEEGSEIDWTGEMLRILWLSSRLAHSF